MKLVSLKCRIAFVVTMLVSYALAPTPDPFRDPRSQRAQRLLDAKDSLSEADRANLASAFFNLSERFRTWADRLRLSGPLLVITLLLCASAVSAQTKAPYRPDLQIVEYGSYDQASVAIQKAFDGFCKASKLPCDEGPPLTVNAMRIVWEEAYRLGMVDGIEISLRKMRDGKPREFAHTQSRIKREDFTKPQPITAEKGIWKPYTGILSVTSSAACWAGAIGDPLSSRGLYETNGLFRNERGQVRTNRGLFVGSLPCVASYALENKYSKAAIIGRFVYGGVKLFLAARNIGLKHGH